MFGSNDERADDLDDWGFRHEFDSHHFNEADEEFTHQDGVHEETTRGQNEAIEEKTTPLFLAAAANMYLDTTVTKFL